MRLKFEVAPDPDTEQWWPGWRWRDRRTGELDGHMYAFRSTAWVGGLLFCPGRLFMRGH
jgi:hypothetical protein